MPEKNQTLTQVAQVLAGTLETLVHPVAEKKNLAGILKLIDVIDGEIAEGTARQCLHAGLWLLADDLEQAHAICQDINTEHGAAWHAVVHRREGDFWNSKYWWRRVTEMSWSDLTESLHKEIPTMPVEMKKLSSAVVYDPAAFVDLVEAYGEKGPPPLRAALVALQRLEWQAIFQACYIAGRRDAL